MKVAAVIVTFNRLSLLKESVKAVLNQTYPLDKVFIVNNCSNDGTREYLDELVENSKVESIHLETNIGGAGGFANGIKKSVCEGYDFTWIMDDDCCPKPNALEESVNVLCVEDNIGFVASHVKWIDGMVHKMNRPSFVDKTIRKKKKDDLYGLNLKHIKEATFVSLLINNEAVKKVGLPISEFFIWHDDIEYTDRIIRGGYVGVFAENSVVVHKTVSNHNANIEYVPLSSAWKLYYQARNTTYITLKEYNFIIAVFKLLNRYSLYIRRVDRRSDDRAILKKEIRRGMLDGLSFRPKIEMVD